MFRVVEKMHLERIIDDANLLYIYINNKFDYNRFYYLFNPIERLDWLKIAQDDKRISVAKESVIYDKIKSILEKELIGKDVDFDKDIWRKKKGYPCFIKLEDIECGDFLLSASYYDSLKNIGCCRTYNSFSLFEERRVYFDYMPLKGKSSWLYVKAPNKFYIEIGIKDIDRNENVRLKESSDGEIKSLTIVKNEIEETETKSLRIPIVIKIPSTLKRWFRCVYGFSFLICICLALFDVFYLSNLLFGNFTPVMVSAAIVSFMDNAIIKTFIAADIAAIIATRSWMISEETILKPFSEKIVNLLCYNISFGTIAVFLLSIISILQQHT